MSYKCILQGYDLDRNLLAYNTIWIDIFDGIGYHNRQILVPIIKSGWIDKIYCTIPDLSLDKFRIPVEKPFKVNKYDVGNKLIISSPDGILFRIHDKL